MGNEVGIAEAVERASAAWRLAAQRLRIVVIAPARVAFGSENFEFICFLPHFGSERGMLVGWHVLGGQNTNRQLREWAARLGVFWSSPSLGGYSDFAEDVFVEALTDWGYFGPEGLRPEWLPGG